MSTRRVSLHSSLALFAVLTLSTPAFGAQVENPLANSVCTVGGPILASTCLFSTGNNDLTGRPISARTDFIEDWDTMGFDGLTLATHELFHAIGFTINYADFDAKHRPCAQSYRFRSTGGR